ncbi:MAG: T9SS type A sorting domain-containing protein [Candidatus Kapabacteria bacterium]|nr:T9SS type A sorting domain-containing protein [Candidatus Kapabacteria bacterium]
MKNFLNSACSLSILFIALFGVSVDTKGQIPDYLTPFNENKNICIDHSACGKYHNHLRFQSEDKQTSLNYDILSYDLFLDWRELLLFGKNDSIFFTAIQTIQLQIIEDNTKVIILDAGDLIINSIFIDGDLLTDEVFNTDKTLEIEFPEFKNANEIVEIVINYEIERSYKRGLYYFPKGEVRFQGREYMVEENIAYTFGQPEVSRYWMPCNDNPNDKALTSIAIKVPEDYTALSNGYLDSLYTNPDFDNIHGGYSIYYYKSNEPISTYLMVAVASKYVHFSDEYIRVSNPTESVPVDYYVWQVDYDGDFTKGDKRDAKRSLQQNPEMLKLFAELFVEFPYDNYGIVALEPVWYGGMEHPNMVTINRSWLTGSGELGLAHEAAHQWLGNLITCATWQDIWINEGGASWCEALWLEHRNNDPYAYRFLISQHARHYLNKKTAHHVTPYGISTDSIFIHGVISYSKSGFIYNMLHYYFGREKFLEFIRVLMHDYRFAPISTAEFRDALIKFSPDDEPFIVEFFEHWLYSPGHPVFKIDYNVNEISESDYAIDLTISQVQNPSIFREYYISQVPLLFYKDGIIQKRYEYIHQSRQMIVGINTDFIPDSVSIDWSELLFSIDQGVSSVRTIGFTNEQISVTPNPIVGGGTFQLTFDLTNAAQSRIYIVNALGQEVSEIKSGMLQSGNYQFNIPTSELSSGSYTLVFDFDGRIVAKQVVVL